MGTTPGGGRLGEILIANGTLSFDDVARGLAVARAAGARLGSALVGMGLCEADVVATALAQQHGVAAARDKHLDAIAPETRALLSQATAARLCAVPVGVMKGDAPALVIAMRDPGDEAAIAEIARETGYPVRPAVACEARLVEVIEAWRDRPAAARVSAGPPRIEMLTPPPGPLAAIDRAVEAVAAVTDLDGALEVPDEGPAPTFERALPPPVATGLELADVPVRPPGLKPPSSALRITGPVTPIGGAVLDEPPTASAGSRWLGRGLGLAVVVAAAGVGYSYCRDDAAGGASTGVEIHGTFRSDKLDAHLRLPGTGWRELPRGLDGQLAQLGNHTRADVFMRGDDAVHPDAAAMIVRVTQPGAFPSQIDPAEIRAGLDGMQTQAASLSNGAFTVSRLRCDVTRLRELPLGACTGDSVLLGSSYQLQIFMWVPSTDDAVAVVWFDKDGDGAGDARTLVESFRTD